MSAPAFLTQCNHCHKKIKLADRSVIGKNAKCPVCQQKFIITEYLPITPQSDSQAVTTQAQSKTAQVNKSPEKKLALESPSLAPTLPLPAKTPPLFVPDESSLEPTFPDFTQPSEIPQGEFDFSQISAPQTVLPSKARKKSSPTSFIMMAISTLVILGGGGWYVMNTLSQKPAVKQKPPIVVTEEFKRITKGKVDKFKLVQDLAPTKGDLLDLKLLPAGIRIAAHLRVSQIYGDDPSWQELRASLGPLSEWLKTQIESYSHFKIDEIDQLLIGVLLGARGTPPEIATVVHLKKPVALSDVLINFQVAPLSQFGTDVYGNEKFALVMVDSQTFAFSPPALIEDVINYRKENTITTAGITALLTKEKQDAHFALAFENDDLTQHIPYIFPASIQPVLIKLSEWFGKDAETTLFTFQLQEPFFAELIVRNKAAVKTAGLERTLLSNLAKLPQEVLAVTRMMRPGQLGYEQLIGRLPAMLKVLSLCTTSCTEKQAVHLVTVMPLKAAPNIAAASLLVWDESTRTNFLLAENKSTTHANDKPKKNLPDSMTDRMQVKIDVEFNRVPLQDAFAFIANEIEVKVDIDGDALKAGGYTKNMPQAFSLKQSTVAEICKKIVGQYNQTEIMCIAIDEKSKTLYVLTESVAKTKGLTVYK